jgi:hypothetical protein
MRDLYSRLGVDPSASEQEFRSAISNCTSSTLKADATEVLLISERRRSYDRVYRTLSDIGSLRAHLGLNHGDNWQSPESDDFSREPTHTYALYDELIAKIHQFKTRSKTDGFINSVKKFVFGIFRLAAVFCGLAAIIWIISVGEDSPRPSSTPSSNYIAPSQPAFNEPTLALPEPGTIRRHTARTGIAPLEIKTSAGSNYLVKLEDISTGTNILDVFVRGGSTINIEVPLGTYRLKYAAGQTWYGYEHYFGPDTGYSKADSTFRFYNDGNRVSGYTVILYQVRDGNLRTSRLSPEQF